MKKEFASLTYEQGCEVKKAIDGGVDAAVSAAKNADVVVLVIGTLLCLFCSWHVVTLVMVRG